MSSNALYPNVFFGGGWATDFGPTVPGLRPDDNGNMILPFLWEAEDCLFELDGGPHTMPGTARLNSSALDTGGTRIKALYDYWTQGVGGSPTQRRVLFVGTAVYGDAANGTFSSLKTGLTADAVPHMSQFDDILILANDNSANVPMSYDGTTFQDLAGSPPNFSFSVKHRNWHWAAGVDAAPSTLYYSDQLNPELWTGGASGSISIDPNDGDRITGLVSHKGELWVFKGPYKGSIHRISGSSNSTWARTTFAEGVGAVWQNSIFKFRDDIGFLWSDGSIRSLAATEAYGDFSESSMTVPIQRYLNNSLNFTRLRHAWAVTDSSGRRTIVLLPVNGSSQNNVGISIDFRFTPPRFSKLPSLNYACAANVIDSAASNRPQIFLGGHDGYVEKWGQSTRARPASTVLNYKVTTPYLDFGVPHRTKTLAGIGINMMPKNTDNIDTRWRRDGQTVQSMNIAQGGQAVLGGTSGFVLDTDMLADDRFLIRWGDAETGGEFRQIQFEFRNSTLNSDTEIHSFTPIVEPGGVSTENTYGG